MKKKEILMAIICLLIVIFIMAACGGSSSDKFVGTWVAESAEVKGSVFSVDELEAMGDYSISNLFVVIKKGGAAYISEDGDGTTVDWKASGKGIKIGIQDCAVEAGKIILENNGIKIFMIKQSDNQDISAVISEQSKAHESEEIPSESTRESSSSEEKNEETEIQVNDHQLALILEDIEKQTKATKEVLEKGDALIDEIDGSYEEYKARADDIEQFYSDSLKSSNDLYKYLSGKGIEYYKTVADLGMDYEGWNGAMEGFYNKWNASMEDYYNAWNDEYETFYNTLNEIIESASDSEDYDEYSTTWDNMYDTHTENWDMMFNAYSDGWSKVFNEYSDVWGGFLNNNFDVDALLNVESGAEEQEAEKTEESEFTEESVATEEPESTTEEAVKEETTTEPSSVEESLTTPSTETEATQESSNSGNNASYHSSNNRDVAKAGDTGVYAYVNRGKNYYIYFIIDFDEGYVYRFIEGNGDDTCERVQIDSGDLNSLILVTYHDGSDSWQEAFCFKWKNMPDTLLYQDGYDEYDYSATSLEEALKLRENKKIVDY